MRLLFLALLALCAATCAAQTKTTGSAQPFILGVVEEIHSRELSESRKLNIYLPEGYSPADTARYPVVYLLDGSADEDFIHIVGLYHFNSFEWIQRTPKSIIVGIATVNRRRDFTFPTTIADDAKKYPEAGHSDRFINFIEKELQPYVDKKFRTNSSKTIIGQSLGGLLATEVLLKKPKLFSQYIIVSPGLWWDNGSLLDLKPVGSLGAPNATASVYIGVGKEGLTPTRIPRVMEVDANVLADRLSRLGNPNLKVYFDYLPQEDHATIMHQAVLNALRLLYPRTR